MSSTTFLLDRAVVLDVSSFSTTCSYVPDGSSSETGFVSFRKGTISGFEPGGSLLSGSRADLIHDSDRRKIWYTSSPPHVPRHTRAHATAAQLEDANHGESARQGPPEDDVRKRS